MPPGTPNPHFISAKMRHMLTSQLQSIHWPRLLPRLLARHEAPLFEFGETHTWWGLTTVIYSVASNDTQATNKFPHALIVPKTSFHLPSEPSSGRAMIVYTETPERQVHEPGVSTHKNATTGTYTQNATADTTPLNPAVVSNYTRQYYKLKQRSYLINHNSAKTNFFADLKTPRESSRSALSFNLIK